MLPINILLGAIICTETAKNEIAVPIDEHREIIRDILDTYVFIDFGPKITLCYSYYIRSDENVKLIVFQIMRPDMVKFWKKWFEGAIWIVSCDISDTFQYELKIVYAADNLECYFFIKKQNLLDIFSVMCRYQNDEIIKFSIQTTNKNLLPVLSIQSLDEKNVLIYRPLLPENEYTFLKKIIKEELDYYYESYINHFFLLLVEIVGEQNIKEFEISDASDKVITLNFTKIRAAVFIFESEYIFQLEFLGDFSIKLGYCSREVIFDMESLKFLEDIGPTLCLNFSRFDENLHTELNIQITLYKQKKCPDSFITILDKTSYVNLNFSSEKIITFENQLIDVFIVIRKVIFNDYYFSLYTSKGSNTIPFRMDGKLLDSIKNIRIETFGKTKDVREELNITEFSKGGIYDSITLEFSISQDKSEEPNITNNIIYDILENKSGYFSIQVQTINKILIEYKLNFTPESMCILSSNRLKEHTETL